MIFELPCSSSDSGDIREKYKFQKQLDVFFVTDCRKGHTKLSNLHPILYLFFTEATDVTVATDTTATPRHANAKEASS